MATVTKFATAASGTSWTNPANANADDAAYATYVIAAKNTTGNQNTLSNFGFDASIPAGSTINSVTLEVQHKVSTTGGIAFLESALAIGATVGTFNSDGTEPLADTIATYSAMARPGGGSWTRADLLNGTFTVRLQARSGNNATSVTYSWDYAKVTVDYTPQNFTVTANSGSYSVSGQAATIAKASLVAASSGSYALTGQAATITYGSSVVNYTVTANHGTYSVSGQSATLAYGRVLAAASGNYGISGQAATLKVDRVVTADAGNYAVGGQAVSIAYSGGPAAQASTTKFAGGFHPHLWIAHINGKRFVGTYDEILEAVGATVERTEKRPRIVIKPLRKAPEGASVSHEVMAVPEAKQVQAQLYMDLMPFLARVLEKRQQDEEDDIESLMLIL